MLESTVGEEVLRKGLSKYLKAHKFGNAVTNDHWKYYKSPHYDYRKYMIILKVKTAIEVFLRK